VYALVLVIFLAIDLTWLGVLMAKFYKSELGSLARHYETSHSSTVWVRKTVNRLTHQKFAPCSALQA
ncbi:MAG: DUF2177 family protein, partial [Desulfobacteraceae bacterium]